MYYLIKEKIDSNINSLDISNNIYTTKEEKLKFIRAIHSNKKYFLDILNLMYPMTNAEDIYVCKSFLTSFYSIYNEKLLGLSIQIAIAIIENPHIICVGSDAKIPENATRLYKTISHVESIYKIQYNGNYCILIGSRNKTYSFERMLISTTDSELLPAYPEWIFDVSGWNSLIYSPERPSWNYRKEIFVNDFNIESFLNNYVEYDTIYIIVNDGKYFKQFKVFEKFKHVIFIINVNNIDKKYYQYFNKLPGFRVYINSGEDYNNTKLLSDYLSLNCTNSLIDKSLLNEERSFEFTYKEFGMIRKEDDSYYMKDMSCRSNNSIVAFQNLRNQCNLNIIKNNEIDYNIDFAFKPII